MKITKKYLKNLVQETVEENLSTKAVITSLEQFINVINSNVGQQINWKIEPDALNEIQKFLNKVKLVDIKVSAKGQASFKTY